jgi:uncharacterized membrane protein
MSEEQRAETKLLGEALLFQLLTPAERETLATELESVQFTAGQIVFEYGDPGDSLYVICAGQAEVFVEDATGRRVVLEAAGPGEVLGELSFLDNRSRSATVVATSEVKALRMDRPRLEHFLQQHPHATMALLTAVARRLRQTTELLRRTASRNVNEEQEDRRTGVQKMADWIAEFSGSVPFLVLHGVWFIVWIGINLKWFPPIPVFDPYPFGLLTMVVSLEAIFLSVFVLLSQNRQAAKDRIRSDIEYEVNLKAEMEIAHLHEKVDRFNAQILARLDKVERRLPEKN